MKHCSGEDARVRKVTRPGAIVENLDKPVLAVTNGFALGGGCETATTCDTIVASEHANFGEPQMDRTAYLSLPRTR